MKLRPFIRCYDNFAEMSNVAQFSDAMESEFALKPLLFLVYNIILKSEYNLGLRDI